MTILAQAISGSKIQGKRDEYLSDFVILIFLSEYESETAP